MAYTWSKAEQVQVGQSQFFNERGLTPYDRTNILTINYVWAPTYFAHGNLTERVLLNGWELSGISNFQGGLPYTAASSTDADVGGRSLSTECLALEPKIPELSVDRPNRSDRTARLKLALLRLAVFIVCTKPDEAVERRFL